MSAFEKRWISPAEAASYLSLSAAGVRRLMRQGVIPNVKIGHSRRVDLRALDAELESQIEKSGRRGLVSGWSSTAGALTGFIKRTRNEKGQA